VSKILYQLYHANLAFSAIEEEDLGDVIDKTYFPLLHFAKKTKIKVALELSGYTLEKIKQLRPRWIKQFKTLHNENLVELIGSGYMQIISPIIPYEVNIRNQEIGLKVYKNILGIVPNIAYVNEQVFSCSLVDIYVEVGYKALMMEWNNSVAIHPKWEKEYAYNPLYIKGVNTTIPLIWTDSILFQQFQRSVHSQQSIKDYFTFFHNYIDDMHKVIPIYSSDLEIFNYRPGRFETEAKIEQDEWENIKKLSQKLSKIGDFLLPSEILQKQKNQTTISLTTTAYPIIIKKQDKYSLSRWSACGIDANLINTLCHRYFLQIQNSKKQKEWKNLLHFWGSDYRTHTTHKKWNKAIDFFEKNLDKKLPLLEKKSIIQDINILENNNILIFKKDSLEINFLRNKGLALDSIIVDGKKLPFGTIKHGELSNISYLADFFTGACVIESAITKKITDLVPVNKYNFTKIQNNKYKLSTIIKLDNIANIHKSWIIDIEKKKLTLSIKMKLKQFIYGSIRLGSFSMLNKDKKLYYSCKNGGNKYESYKFSNINIDQHTPKSLLQSSQGGIGATDGFIFFKNHKKNIVSLYIDKKKSNPFIMLQNYIDDKKKLTRVHFSVQELDDTLKYNSSKLKRDFFIKYDIIFQN